MPSKQERLTTSLRVSLYGMALTELGTFFCCLAYCGITHSNYSMLSKTIAAASTGVFALTPTSLFAAASYDYLYPTRESSLTAPLTVTINSLPSVKKQREALMKYIACVFSYSLACAPSGQAILAYLFHTNKDLSVTKAFAITAIGSFALLVLVGFASCLYKLWQIGLCKKEEIGPRLSESSLNYVVSNILSAPPSDDGASSTSESLNDTGEFDDERPKPESFDAQEAETPDVNSSCCSKICPSW